MQKAWWPVLEPLTKSVTIVKEDIFHMYKNSNIWNFNLRDKYLAFFYKVVLKVTLPPWLSWFCGKLSVNDNHFILLSHKFIIITF